MNQDFRFSDFDVERHWAMRYHIPLTRLNLLPRLIPVTRLIPIMLGIALLAPARAADAEALSFEKASQQLQAATVTVRVIPKQPRVEENALSEVADERREGEASERAVAKQVIVCSGASLGDGLIITYADIAAQDEVRITIPGGEQATAKLKVLDHVSGLTLLETDNTEIPALKAAEQIPNVGAWVLSGAGWGSEKPVVSFGILAGVNRAMRGATFPPLLQCDLRTADTSNGAPLVNSDGELIGVIVASGAGESESRWTYAAPVKHVKRLVRARRPNQVIEIKKVRPVVGMHLDMGPAPNTVVVRRVTENGPADKAGVREGDRILLAEGMNIRSPYQVVGPLLSKQPGETMDFTLERDGQRHELEIVLGGGTVLQPKPRLENIAGLKPAGTVDVSRRVFLSSDGPPKEEIVIQNSNADQGAGSGQRIGELELQHKAITTYLSALQRMQEKINVQKKELLERDRQIEALQRQLKELQEAPER